MVTDRPDAVYHVGEKATFTISVLEDGKPVTEGEVSYRLSADGAKNLGEGKLPLTAPLSVTGTLDVPGFLQCSALYAPAVGAKPVYGLGGVAYDPEKIQPTAVMPKDFDEYWNKQKAELAKIPMDVKMTPVPEASNDTIEMYKISLANIDGSRVHGYFGKPKGDGPFPAILLVPAAGVYGISPGWAGHAGRGFIAMGIIAHNVDIDLPKEEYVRLNENELENYPYQGREDRDTYYFRRVFLSVMRAIDYLTSRSEWDKQHVIIHGSSQGGALSLIGAGLNPRITALAANVPAMCDHSGIAFGRVSGWPRLVPANNEQVLKVSAYYDAVNFARKTKAAAIVGVGFIDTTCAPTTVYAAYNVLQGPKQIIPTPLMGHAQSSEYSALKEKWIMEQAGIK